MVTELASSLLPPDLAVFRHSRPDGRGEQGDRESVQQQLGGAAMSVLYSNCKLLAEHMPCMPHMSQALVVEAATSCHTQAVSQLLSQLLECMLPRDLQQPL